MGGVHPLSTQILHDVRGPFSVCARGSGSPPSRGTRVCGVRKKTRPPTPASPVLPPERGDSRIDDLPPLGEAGLFPVFRVPREGGEPDPYAQLGRDPLPRHFVSAPWVASLRSQGRSKKPFPPLRGRGLGVGGVHLQPSHALHDIGDPLPVSVSGSGSPPSRGTRDVWGSPYPMGRCLPLICGTFDRGCRFGEVGQV